MKNQNSSTELFKEYKFHIQDITFTIIADKNAKYVAARPEAKGKEQLHFHSCFELFYVYENNLTLEFEDGEYDFKENSLIIISPFVNHQTVINDAEILRYNLSFLMERNSMSVKLSLFDAMSRILITPYLVLQGTPELRRSVIDTLQSIEVGDDLRVSFNFHKLITEILEHVDIYSILPKMRVLPNSDSNMMRGYKLQALIYKHYKEDISLALLAEKLFLSTRQISRLIKQFYGCTYRELITKMRMKAAAELLQSEKMSVLEIAVYVGYTSLKGFYSAFKNEYGCLPTELRKLRESE